MKNKNKKSFILYLDQEEIIDALTDEQAGMIVKAIFDYSKGKEVELDAVLSIVFIQFKQMLERDGKKWDATRRARKLAGRLGGLARARNELSLANATHETTSKASKIKQTLANQAVSVSVSDSVSVNKELQKINSSSKANIHRPRGIDLILQAEAAGEFKHGK